MKAGKDVYGEKPACYNIYEGQKMVQVARETKTMVQIGSQHRSTPFKMKAMEALQRRTDRQDLSGERPLLQAPRVHRAQARQPDASRRELGHVPRTGADASLQRTALQVQLALVLERAMAISAIRACMKWASRAGAWATPSGPRPPSPRAASTPIDDDQETPNTLLSQLRFRRPRDRLRSARPADRRRRLPTQRRTGAPAAGARRAPSSAPAPTSTTPPAVP